jgi:metal-responsive CopG/Arc/MetJ family transcriptional regulator
MVRKGSKKARGRETQRVRIILEPDLLARMDQRASELGISRSEIVERGLRKILALYGDKENS